MENCADCKQPYPYLQRAHVVAKHKGGTNDPSNIVRVCPNCHHLRDRADRVEWNKKRWAKIPPAKRSRIIKQQWAKLSARKKKDRASRISASKMGKKHPPGHKTGGARFVDQDVIDRRAEANKQAWANKTPEEREAWRQRCREIKQKVK